ncbi:MAG: hypothetical protein NT154_06700 [Verrucomicrobia bacterium]|nr:hypothetical protein [Verrucomicrobiota bacterium]
MNTRVFLLLSLALFGRAAQSAQVPEGDFPNITISGITYTNAHLRAYSSTEGSLRHDAGVEKIKLADLPEPALSRFYNPDQAKQDTDAKARALAEKQAAAKAATDAAIEKYRIEYVRMLNGKPSNTQADRRWIAIEGKVQRVLTNGIILQIYELEKTYHPPEPRSGDALVSGGNFLGSSRTPEGEYTYRMVPTERLAFIACSPKVEGFRAGKRESIKVIETDPVKVGSETYRGYDAGLPYQAQP